MAACPLKSPAAGRAGCKTLLRGYWLSGKGRGQFSLRASVICWGSLSPAFTSNSGYLFEPFHWRTSHFEGVCHVPVGLATLCPLCWMSLSAAAATVDLFGLPANTRQSSSHLRSANLACEGFAEGSLTTAPPACTASPCAASPLNKTRKNVAPQKHSVVFSVFPDGRHSHMPPFLFVSLFSFPSTSPKSHANTLGESICLDWIDGPRAFFLLTKAAPNMVSYRGIMLSCQSVWAGDPLCQSPSGTAVSALTTRHAALTCPAPTRAPAGGEQMPLKGMINAFQWVYSPAVSINIADVRIETFPRMYFSEVWLTWRKLRVLINRVRSGCRRCLAAASRETKEKQTNASLWSEVRETKAQRITLSFHAWSFPYVPLEPPAHPSHFTRGKTAVWESSIFTVQQSIKLHQIQ